MPSPEPGCGVQPPSRLLQSLEALTRAHPTSRKHLVGPDVNFGRELLVTLAQRTGGWLGWEAATLRRVADALALLPLAERELTIASDVEIGALVHEALDEAIEAREVGGRFAALARSLGFRRTLHDALMELRTAGVRPDDLRRGAAPGSPAAELPPVLARYERLLAGRRRADTAEVFRAALDAFEQEAPFVLDGIVAIAPSLATRGLPGELLARLVARGARVLASDPVLDAPLPTGVAASLAAAEHAGASPLAWVQAAGLPAPDDRRLDAALVAVDLFAAATPSDELREVCRRVLAEKRRWDDVEIVTTDPDTYGVALDALCQRLEIGATMLHGVPLARTRLGRALDRWLAWLDDGLPADVLRQALEAGELNAPDAELPPSALARELRRLEVGWGRGRYQAALDRLESRRDLGTLQPYDDEGDEEFAARRAARERSAGALARLLRALLDVTPTVPERGSDRPVRTSCARLAAATLGFLALVPVHGQAEGQTLERLRSRLALLAEVEDAESSFGSALAALRDALGDLRAWPLVTSERKPWSAAGGMVHLTDVAHAGTTGRRRVFVVGLDADRTGGAGRQDPLLPDAVRRAVAGGALATSAERREERAWQVASALAALRGRVTLSYATSGSLDGREAGPSPVLLQAWRLARGDASLGYDALRDAVRPPASAVPARGAGDAPVSVALLDARDVWLDALAEGALLLDGTRAVREAFPLLAAGLAAQALAVGDRPSAHHGLVPDAGAALDPAARPDRAISPSALEKLAACPLAWFYGHGLRVRPPRDPEYDAERWLDAAQRGALLHEVYEAFTTEYQGRQAELAGPVARDRVLAAAEAAIHEWRRKVPPPGEAVFEQEARELRGAALAFLQMERERWTSGDHGVWRAFELAFGDGERTGTFALAGGATLQVRGRADRIDELPDGTLRVVDYKTGRATRFAKSARKGAFDGGRQLQPALYVAAVQTILGRTVSRFEYRFPTERGANEVVTYSAEELAPARTIVGELLAHVRAGEFIPTNDDADCTYCDYAGICRGGATRAGWAKEHAGRLPVYATRLARRGPTTPGDSA